jgi:hypothetical protein
MKKEYRKPQIVKVSLKVEETVLGGCKFQTWTGSGSGIDDGGCNYPTYCVAEGS